MANDISHKDRHTVPKGFRNEGEKCVSKRRAKEEEKKPLQIFLKIGNTFNLFVRP